MTQDEPYVPKTRFQLGLAPLDASKEAILGGSITDEAKQELRDALGDSPIGAAIGLAQYLVSCPTESHTGA